MLLHNFNINMFVNILLLRVFVDFRTHGRNHMIVFYDPANHTSFVTVLEYLDNFNAT